MLFYVGDVIPQVSDELLQTADVMNIPLILIEDEAEYSVSYSDVIKDVMGAVFYDQASTDSFSDTVENRLKQIPYNKRSMEYGRHSSWSHYLFRFGAKSPPNSGSIASF